MGKRKENQRRDDSTSSNAKRRRSRHSQTGPNDADLFRDAVIEIKDAIQDKESTEAKFNRKFEKLKGKRKKDKQEIRVLKDDIRILKKGYEDLKSKIQEMQKEGCAEADHYKSSPSERSQLSKSTRFRLKFENRLCTPIYKNETVGTEDGGGHIKVIMYDGGSPIAPDHLLASVRVDLVVIEGRFNDKRDSWSKEEFEKSIITPREKMTRLVKNGTFDLIGGSCDHPGAIIMDNSQKKEVKLGVMVAVPTEERVIEGISNPFKVQEGKTKRLRKNGKQPCPLVPTQNLVQPTSNHATQHGLALNNNGQNFSQQIPAHNLGQSTHACSMQNEDCGPRHLPATATQPNFQQFSQQILPQNFGQTTHAYSTQHGQGSTWAPTTNQNQQAAGYCLVNQPLLAYGQDQYTRLPNGSSEHAHQNHSAYALSNDIRPTFIPEDVHYSNADIQMQPTWDSTFICGRVLLQWDNSHVELRERWNFLDQPVPLYSTNSRIYGESFPSTTLMDKTHKLLGSISSVGTFWTKKMPGFTSGAMQTPHKRGVLIRLIEPYDSDDEPPLKKQRNDTYTLRFVNRVCNDYYLRNFAKSEDGTFLKVALYDENNLVVTSGPLSSASVEVVLLHGDFNAEGQDYWTPEEFSIFRVHGQGLNEGLNILEILGGDPVLALTNGEADLANIYFLISSFAARTGKFKMGVQIKNTREDNVQEGITSPFVVRPRLEKDSWHPVPRDLAFLGESMAMNDHSSISSGSSKARECKILDDCDGDDYSTITDFRVKSEEHFPTSATSRAIVPVCESKRAVPFSWPEVEALVEAVEQLGTGRWRDVKMRAFHNTDHRTYVDLKNKWKTLVHMASISPRQRQGEQVPQRLLDRVLVAQASRSNNSSY